MSVEGFLSPRDRAILASIRAGICTSTDLARVYLTTKGAMSVALSRLRSLGFLEHGPSDTRNMPGHPLTRWRVRRAVAGRLEG